MSKNRKIYKTASPASAKANKFKLSTREREQSQRQLKVSQLALIAINDCLRKGKGLDPVLFSTPLTITKINISPDLRIVNCYFLPFNTNISSDNLLKALENSSYKIRDYVTKAVKLKYSPEIRFYFDQGFGGMIK